MVLPRRGTIATVAALSLAVAGPAALAAQTASAAPATSSTPTPRGLLDPIIGIITTLQDQLKALLGGTALADLSNLTSVLTGGGAASSDALAPVTSLLDGLAAKDAQNASLLSAVSALTKSGSDGPLAAPFLAPVAALLGQLATLDGLTGAQAGALSDLKAALDGILAGALPTDLVAGLPLDNLSLDPSQLLALGDLLGVLQGGTESSPELLAPVVALLKTVASTSGLPAPFADIINSLATQLESATSLDSGLLTPVGQLLNAIAATPGASDGGVLGSLSGLLGSQGKPPAAPKPPTTTTPTTPTTPTTKPPATTTLPPGAAKPPTTAATPAATPAAKPATRIAATLRSARYDRKRGSLVLTLSCAPGTGACGAIVYALNGSRTVVKPLMALLTDGQVVQRRMRLDAKSRSALKKKTLKLKIYTVTSKTQIAARGLTIKRAAKARAKS